jgi:uncharacterized protein (TIGR02646 family)
MKRVPTLDGEPSELAAWRAANPNDAGSTSTDAKGAWDRFRSAGGAYRQLLAQLLARQQGLCGYCEQRLSETNGTPVFNDYQLEHVLAKSGGDGRVLDWHNLMLCCGGGTWPHHKDDSRHLPGHGGAANVSCGQTKGDGDLHPGCDPRTFPWREPVVGIGLDGRMRANEDACRGANIDPNALQQTIDEVLGLNCERLRMTREKLVAQTIQWFVDLLEAMLALSSNLPETEAASIRKQLVGGRLRPDAHGHLNPFWTMERLYLGDLAEAWIRDNAASLHFD